MSASLDIVRVYFAAALVDGEVQEEEKKLLFNLAGKAALSMGQIAEVWDEVASGNHRRVNIPTDPKLKRELFDGIVSIVTADRLVTRREDKFLRRLAKSLKMEDELETEREHVGSEIWPSYDRT